MGKSILRIKVCHSFFLYLYTNAGYNSNDFKSFLKGGEEAMGDKGGKKDKAKSAKQTQTKKDSKKKK